MTLQTGTRIGPYEIQSALGAGGMGEVYRARDLNLGRDVALKVLPEGFIADSERIARFQREAQLLAALHHPNIASVFGLETAGPARVLAMELVEGESLAARLKNGPLPLDEAIAIAKQIGDALSAAHERGIIHRDLKPPNIMLTHDVRVKVLDFGLAKMVETEAIGSGLTMSPTLSVQATLAGTILGTAPYMSPEQARGRPVDKRTDVWAFGCVLFEMLSGKRAFDGEDTTETIATIVKGEPDWSAIPATIPSNIVTILRGCLTKNPKERFADIAVPLYLLTAKVETAPAPEPVVVPAIPAWKRALPVAAAAVIAMLLTGAAAWFTRPVPPAPAVTQFTFPLPDGQAFSNTGRKVIALSPDGSQILYVANQQLYLRSMADTEPHMIPGTDSFKSTLTSPAFSPDGREIVFYTGLGQSVKRIAVSGGTAVTVCEAQNPTGMRWEPEGILFGQTGKGIFRVSPNGGTPQQVAPAAADEIPSTPESLPDGRGLLYSIRKGLTDTSWDTGSIVVQTAAGERKTLVRGGSDGRYDGAGHLLYTVSGVVMAVPFDIGRLEVSGTPVPAIEGVMHQVTGQISGATQYSVSPNGTLAYAPGPVKVTDDNVLTLAIYDAKGVVEGTNLPQAQYRYPRVSPDGRTVVFELGGDADTNIWLQDLTSNSANRRLTFGGQNRAPIWSSDGQWIAFQSDRDGDAAILRQRADGSGVAERLTKPDKNERHWPQSWSPDGAYLLFSVEKDKTFELHLLSAKDKTTRRFSDVTSAINLESAFSPDGRWIVYQRSDKGDTNLPIQSFLEPFPATGAKFLVPLSVTAGHPYWSRKGDRLYFNTSATTSAFVDVKTAPTVSFSPPQSFPRARRNESNPFTSRRNVDSLPDGRVLGVGFNVRNTPATTAEADQITVILNWQQALNAKLAH